MDDIKIRLLTKEELYGGLFKRPLSVFKSFGRETAGTDLADLIGHVTGGTCSAEYYTQSKSGHCILAFGEDDDGDKYTYKLWRRIPTESVYGVRPVLEIPKEKLITLPKKEIVLENGQKVTVCQYGFYPQHVSDSVPDDLMERQRLIDTGQLQETGQNYSTGGKSGSSPFVFEKHPVYQYEYKFYINASKECPYSWKKYSYWFSVEPIEWLVDDSGLLISKKCLLAGIPASLDGVYDGNFQNTLMGKFLKETFLPEIMQEEIVQERIRTEQFEKDKQILITLKREEILKQLPDWLAIHPNPTKEDFLSVPTGQDKNMINLLVDAGIDALRQALPPEKWVGRKKDLIEIFATVDKKNPKTRLTLSCFDARLKARAHKQLVQAKYLKARKIDQH